jgi:two-component system response regulator RegA
MGGAVLVVDDQDGMRQTMRRALSLRGYRVILAHDRSSALYAARLHTIDCAIVDQNLRGTPGDQSGLNLIEDLLETCPGLRVLVHTGYASTEAAFRAGRLSAIVGYLPKPATIAEIVAKLEGHAARAAQPNPCRLDQVEREHLLRVLADNGGNCVRAAAALGITRATLRRKLGR